MKSIILDYAIERKGDTEIIYQYDFLESLNIITVDNKKMAFIESTHKDIYLLTKTKVRNESDDETNDLLEMQTKTRVRSESDDELNFLLELQTKTFTIQESDD